MRPLKFVFGLLFAAAVAIVFLKLLFFAAAGLLIAGLLFAASRMFRYRRYGHPEWRRAYHAYQMGIPAGDYPAADPLDPRMPRHSAEPLAGARTIDVI
ncbi:MAG: hypothetical protein IT259_20035 [Saprospiraceae bacterium]|nr:hypothetical protein [Saprospiraceae bacterium]